MINVGDLVSHSRDTTCFGIVESLEIVDGFTRAYVYWFQQESVYSYLTRNLVKVSQ
jgi:hypothetical protein